MADGERDARDRRRHQLVQAYLRGMRLAGMAATIKHFPGHGSIAEDTHFDVAIDPRPLDALRETDLVPFADGIAAGASPR